MAAKTITMEITINELIGCIDRHKKLYEMYEDRINRLKKSNPGIWSQNTKDRMIQDLFYACDDEDKRIEELKTVLKEVIDNA